MVWGLVPVIFHFLTSIVNDVKLRMGKMGVVSVEGRWDLQEGQSITCIYCSLLSPGPVYRSFISWLVFAW